MVAVVMVIQGLFALHSKYIGFVPKSRSSVVEFLKVTSTHVQVPDVILATPFTVRDAPTLIFTVTPPGIASAVSAAHSASISISKLGELISK